MPNGGTPGAAARISITRLPDAAALQSGDRARAAADVSLDDLPGHVVAGARRALGGARRPAPRSGGAGRSPTSACGVRLSLALDRRALARLRRRATWRRRARCCSTRRRRAPCPPIPRALARCCAAPGPRARCSSMLWAEPGAQARVARAIASQLAAIGVQGRRARRRAGRATRAARGLDRVAVPGLRRPGCDLHAARRCPAADGPQAAIAKRVRRIARLAGDARRAAFRRLDERLGAGGIGAIPLLRANFSTPISSMLVGRGTHPVFDVDLALLSTRP